MRGRINQIWQLFLYTCTSNSFSIVAGSLFAFAGIAGLSLFFPLKIVLMLCPILTFLLFLSVTLLYYKLNEIMSKFELQSSVFGVFLGCVWIIFLAVV